MSIDRTVMAFAGLVVLLSLALSQIHHSYWLFLTAFVGRTCSRLRSPGSARSR